MDTVPARKESTVKDFLEVIFRRKMIIISIVLIATTIVVILNMREPAIYESSAKVLVKRGEVEGVFDRGIRTLTWEEEISSQIEMIKSQVVINRSQEILPDYFPEKYEPKDKINTGRVGTGVVSTSNVLWVTYTSGDPIFCEAAVNAITNSYKEYYQRVRTPPEMEDFFSREIQNIESEIEYWRERSEKTESEWGILDIKQQGRNTLERLEKYRTDISELETDKRELVSVIDRLERFRSLSIDEQLAITEGLTGGSRESVVENLRRRLMDFRIEESRLAASFTDRNKELMNVRKQIDDLYNLIDGEINSVLLVKRNQLAIMTAREEALQDIVGQLEHEGGEIPRKKVEVDRIESTLARLESNYSELMQQHLNAKITIASNPEWTVTIINPATPAYRKKTRDYVRIALGPVFSLIIALGFAFFVDNLDHSIKNVSEAEETLNLHVLASFPDTEKK